MSNMLEESASSKKLATSTGTASLGKFRFSYGIGTQTQWIKSNNAFLDHVGSRFGQSAKASLEVEESVVAEVNKKDLPKFKKKEDMEACVKGLECWEEEKCELAKEIHSKLSGVVLSRLLAVHGVSCSACDVA